MFWIIALLTSVYLLGSVLTGVFVAYLSPPTRFLDYAKNGALALLWPLLLAAFFVGYLGFGLGLWIGDPLIEAIRSRSEKPEIVE